MRVLMICNISQSILLFRLPLIKRLQRDMHEVAVVCFDEEFKAEIENENILFFKVEGDNRSINPLKILKLKKLYSEIIKFYGPDIVFTFMMKPNIFGVLAANSCGVKNVFSMVEGAGDVFIYNTLKWRIVRKIVCQLYKLSFAKTKKVFFLNTDDAKEFAKLKLLKKEKITIIKGIGVDLERFVSYPVKTSSNSFLMVARMLESKGIWEYIKCAELVKKNHPEVEFNYLGSEGNVKVEDIQAYIDKGIINYLGTTRDVRPYLDESLMLILPSYYREGLPMSIMEAEASGRGIITSNNVGCRDTVVDGYNGYLTEKKDYRSIAQRCIEVLQDKQLAVKLGENARKFAEENFDQKKINEKIIHEIFEDSLFGEEN